MDEYKGPIGIYLGQLTFQAVIFPDGQEGGYHRESEPLFVMIPLY